MFGTVLLVVSTLMHLYVFWRLRSVPWVRRRVPRGALIGAAAVLWLLLAAGRLVGHGGAGPGATIVELAGMDYLAALFICATCLLAAELATGFGFFLRRLAPALRGWALVAGAVLAAFSMAQGARAPVVEDFTVELPGLPAAMDGAVVVGLSDLHIGSLLGENWLRARVGQVAALRPDLVVLLGDLFEGHGAPSPAALSILGELSAPLGVWAVPGNHESFRHGGGPVSLEQAGIRELRNRWEQVRPGFTLAGVEDLKNGGRMAQALEGRPPGATILLSHSPLQADTAARAGAGLMLCGHTHGGQVWPFGYLVRLEYPLVDGLYRVKGMPVIVCRGTGTWGPRMRLWRPAQILRVTLRAGEKKTTPRS